MTGTVKSLLRPALLLVAFVWLASATVFLGIPFLTWVVSPNRSPFYTEQWASGLAVMSVLLVPAALLWAALLVAFNRRMSSASTFAHVLLALASTPGAYLIAGPYLALMARDADSVALGYIGLGLSLPLLLLPLFAVLALVFRRSRGRLGLEPLL